MLLSVKKSRKEKIRLQLTEVLSQLTVKFDDLEKLRGRLISISLVCPFSRLFIREMNRLLQLAEANLQVHALKLFL